MCAAGAAQGTEETAKAHADQMKEVHSSLNEAQAKVREKEKELEQSSEKIEALLLKV